MKTIFVTGVDTDIGKTFVSIGLLIKLENENKNTGYFKPFQSGAFLRNNELIAPDVDELKKYSSIETKYSYLFKGEVSPYLASIIDNVDVDINKVKKDLEEFSSKKDFVVIEGAGGLLCPCYKNKTFLDLIKELKQEIIIVTTPKLGRLNHTLLTIECAKKEGVKIKGIIINKMSKNKTLSEINFIKELNAFSSEKILGIIPEMSEITKENILLNFKDINLL